MRVWRGTTVDAAGEVYGEVAGVAVGEGRTNRSARASIVDCLPCVVAAVEFGLVVGLLGNGGYRAIGLVAGWNEVVRGGERAKGVVLVGGLPWLVPPVASIESLC